MNIEEKVKMNLIARGFGNETMLNNRGLIGATIDETILEVVKNLRIADVSVSLLEEAAILVGNPGTNISGSCDVACMEWQEKYERWRNER